MDERERLQAELRATFAEELRERAAALDRDLQSLVEAVDPAALNAAREDFYRTAYNLQGAARVVELPGLAHLASAVVGGLPPTGSPPSATAAAWIAAARRAIAFLPRLAADSDGSQPPELLEILADLVAAEPNGTFTGETGAMALPPSMPTVPPPLASDPPSGVGSVPQAASAAPVASATPGAVESVRVRVEKLDALFADTGELAVARIRIGQRLAELGSRREEYAGWRREARAIGRRRSALRRQLAALPLPAALLREFDEVARAAEIAEARLTQVGEELSGLTARLRGDVAQLGTVSESLADEVLAVRLLPVSSAFGPFDRLVRDLARDQGKAIALTLDGGSTEIDRKILERLRDPLMHMLRNAVDHGIEATAARIAAGKPPTGQIRLMVENRGGAVAITLSDDGGGLDPERLRAAAVRKGLLAEDRAAALDDEAAYNLIFHPGFSTTAVPTATSGRGVGMDVVRDEVTRLGGQVRIDSALGRGTTFTIAVPLTLATTRAILLEIGGQRMAIPSMPVERTARLRLAALVPLEGRRTVTIDGRPVPVVALADILAMPPPTDAADPRGWQAYLVLREGDQRLAILVDRLIGEQEFVVKPLGWPLRRVRHLGGVATLGSGETVAILNPSDLLRGGQQLVGTGARPNGTTASAARVAARPVRRRRVLVVDDSLTTRTLERGILEAAGYDALVATDGAEALNLLGREGVDLVVSDVEMPRLDGFGLAAAIRRDERLRHIPVILVTSLDAPEYRERGVSAGADAYLTKGAFDQGELLDTIGRLL